jgi:4-amino-4-deoxy-L-arabinose transferase-like glycosyltransferase
LGNKRPGFAVALGGIGAVAFVIRIAFVRIVDPKVPALGDATAYHLLGENLAHGDGYIRPFDALLLHQTRPTAEYPPLFPLLLSIPARLGVHSVTGQREFVAIVGAITVVLIGLLGRRVGGPTVGLVAAALAACYPMLFQSEGMLMAEALYAPLVVVVLLCAYRTHDRVGIGNFALFGVAVGLATLTRAEGLLLGIVVAIGLGVLLRDRTVGARIGFVAVAIGVALLVIAPWTIRNAVRFHAFVPVSTNVSTLVDGANCDATYHGALLGLWRGTFGPGDVNRALPQSVACFEGFDIKNPHFNEASDASTHLHDGLAYASHHAGDQPKVMAVRVLRTWALYAPKDQVNFETLEGRPKTWQWVGTIMFWVMLPFAIAGVVLARRRHTFVWPLIASAITVTIVAALTYGQQRFRIAAEPAVIVLAALAFCDLARRVRR